MQVVVILLLIVSFACFLVGAAAGHAGTAVWARTNNISLGLALWVLVVLLTALRLV
jgi:hypothetical protein